MVNLEGQRNLVAGIQASLLYAVEALDSSKLQTREVGRDLPHHLIAARG